MDEERKTWIKVLSSLLEPKHQRALGARIWLFLYLLDRADWDTGIVTDYTDADAGGALGAPARTVQRWRQDLEAAGYVVCEQHARSQDITIRRWRNPRLVNAVQQNLPPEGTQEGTQICVGRVRKNEYPFYIDHNQITESQVVVGDEEDSRPSFFTVYEQNIGVLTPLIADRLKDLEDTTPPGWFEEAVEIACQQNIRKLAYVEGILDRWAREGRGATPAPVVERKVLR